MKDRDRLFIWLMTTFVLVFITFVGTSAHGRDAGSNLVMVIASALAAIALTE